jgi:hypothetical protein
VAQEGIASTKMGDLPSLSPANGASARRKCMADQVTDKSSVAEKSPVRVVEMALPSSTSPSDALLRRIAALLSILVAGLLTVFGFYASSICITVVLAGFLASLQASERHSISFSSLTLIATSKGGRSKVLRSEERQRWSPFSCAPGSALQPDLRVLRNQCAPHLCEPYCSDCSTDTR